MKVENKYPEIEGKYKEILAYRNIPEDRYQQITDYALYGYCNSLFISALMSNDFEGIFTRGTSDDIDKLRGYMAVLINDIPHSAHGSKEKYEDYSGQGGLMGIFKKQKEENSINMTAEKRMKRWIERKLRRMGRYRNFTVNSSGE